MNREIKFRAWHSGMKRIVPCEELTTDQLSLLANGYFANVHPGSERLTEIFPHDQMMPMQYTGLRDKNGVEIYEGDILEERLVLNGPNGEDVINIIPVEWGSWCYVVRHGETYAPALDSIRARSVMTVIGNIYENPDLI
jgi:uncharacterized phage protein (TIGR01671 family)